MMPFLMTENDL